MIRDMLIYNAEVSMVQNKQSFNNKLDCLKCVLSIFQDIYVIFWMFCFKFKPFLGQKSYVRYFFESV